MNRVYDEQSIRWNKYTMNRVYDETNIRWTESTMKQLYDEKIYDEPWLRWTEIHPLKDIEFSEKSRKMINSLIGKTHKWN